MGSVFKIITNKIKSFTAPILIVMFLGMVLLIVFQANGAARNDSFYTDLSAFPMYVNNGFQPSYATLTNPDSLDWDLTLPPHSGQGIISELPEPKNATRYGMFSTTLRDIEEFTLLIPFTLDTELYETLGADSSCYPSFYFSGLGENWEIFLNGHSVARQIFLDESGRITRFRSVYGISIPVSKEYLASGENTLVFHILGARSSKWTGLRYAAPYYLGDNSNTLSDFARMSSLVMCTIFFFTGLYHLLIYAFRKTDRYNLLFAAFTLIASGYYLVKMQILYSILPNTEHVQRLDYVLLYLLIFIGAAFLENINSGKISRVTTGYGIFCVALAVLQWFFPIWFAYDLLSVWQIVSILFVLYFIVFDLLWQIYKGAVEQCKGTDIQPGLWRGIYLYLFKTEFGNIYVMLMIVGITAIIDIISVILFNVNFTLSKYSYLGFVLSMAYILARKYSKRDELPELENSISQESMASAGLTQNEINVTMMMLEGVPRRDITRKLNINISELDRYDTAIRQKLGLADSLDPVISGVAEEYGLTKRETEMLKYLRENAATEKIAADLFISEITVRGHISNLLTKLGLEKRQDAAAWLEKREQRDL